MCGEAHHATIVIRYMLTNVPDSVVAPFRGRILEDDLTSGYEFGYHYYSQHSCPFSNPA